MSSWRWRPRAAFALLVSASMAFAHSPVPAWAGELTQYFPAVPDGEAAKRPESGWKIAWQVRQPKTHDYGGSAVWELQSVRFMKGYNADGSQDWVTVLNRLALAEMYVPYHEGRYFLDISGGQVVDGRFHPFHFHMVKARKDFFPSLSAVKPQLHDEYVISEVADDHVRWMDNRRRDMVRRGQALHLWATLNSGNYRYVLRYSFADDGSIGVRAGGTAENFFDLGPAGSGDHATHIHMAAWRMEFDLGNPDTNKLEMIERRIDANRQPFTDKRPFNKGREGGEVWDPLKFSALKISSGQTQNRHQPPRNIAYILRPLRTGTVRTTFPFTQNDFWVTRLRPDNPNRVVDKAGLELRFVDVPKNVANPEPIDNKAVVIWHQSGLNHIPRTEDFGQRDYRSFEGVAITAWTGFDLVPVDLWHQTPFLDRPPPPPRDLPPPPGDRPPSPPPGGRPPLPSGPGDLTPRTR
jgi:Copper amine oxidase, enzyme domain